ncbi:hypothetical protein [Candidatus Methylobacter oryzae]|uniref:DUF1292 domain-containing protein n=1 Tax=Candidatus Methylobacter oryzae TaxID=2497749 RepID=A0ABY3CDE9_9GAMM|nr:hypothetical protein [Candidatus Methylobacter oryzae]TRX00457.1 hypothetical protein EKO24_005595 [Candidatus Methylobacter oryzae]
MTVDFNRLKHFSMTYVFMDGEDVVYEYEQTEQEPVVAPDGNSIGFALRNIDQSEDKDIYSVVLVKNDDDEFDIKSDYFGDADEPYPLDVEIFEEDVKFTLEGEDEVMYLYGFFE